MLLSLLDFYHFQLFFLPPIRYFFSIIISFFLSNKKKVDTKTLDILYIFLVL